MADVMAEGQLFTLLAIRYPLPITLIYLFIHYPISKMKKLVLPIAFLISLFLVAMPVAAQAEKCALGTLNVANDVSAIDARGHSKTSFLLSCENTTKDFGQVTKVVYNVPLTDITSFEASDSLGTMKVLEGPAYATVTAGAKESTLGVIFRKPLLITDVETSAVFTVEFDSFELIGVGENGTYSISPGKQVSNPKTTIITNGITESTYTISKVNYELSLPTDASVQTMPTGCVLQGGKVKCQGLNQTDFNSLKIDWSKPQSAGGILTLIKNKVSGLLPGITNLFKGISSKIMNLIKGR